MEDLLVQSFTAHMPLLTAASAFGLGNRRWNSQQCYAALSPYLKPQSATESNLSVVLKLDYGVWIKLCKFSLKRFNNK